MWMSSTKGKTTGMERNAEMNQEHSGIALCETAKMEITPRIKGREIRGTKNPSSEPPPVEKKKRKEIARVNSSELSRCIADPAAIAGKEKTPAIKTVSPAEPEKGLKISLETLKRARKIFQRIL